MREISVNKRYALGWYNEGITYLNIHDYQEAMSFFEKALNIIPDHPDFLVGKGDVLYATGKYEEAYQIFQHALSVEPDSIRILLRIGMVLLQLGRYADALAIFDRGLSLNEYDGELWLGRGMAEFHLGRMQEAAASFKNTVRYKPNQPALWHYLSRLESSDEEALKLLLRGYRLDTSNLDILIAMVERLLHMNRIKEADEFCRRARVIDPENSRITVLQQRLQDLKK